MELVLPYQKMVCASFGAFRIRQLGVVPARRRPNSLGSHRERIPQRRLQRQDDWSGITAFTRAAGIKESNILVSNCNIHYQITTSVCIYGILTRNKFIKHALRLLLPLIFAGQCLPYRTPAVVSQHIWTPFSTVHIFDQRNILMETFVTFIGDGSSVFRKKKIQMGMQKMKFQRHVTRPCMMKLAPAKFHCNFPLFHCLETFCRRFQMPSRLFFSLGLRIVV